MLSTCLFLARISSAALSGAMGRATIRTWGFGCRFSGNVEVVRCYKPQSFGRHMCDNLLVNPFVGTAVTVRCGSLSSILNCNTASCKRSAGTHFPRLKGS